MFSDDEDEAASGESGAEQSEADEDDHKPKRSRVSKRKVPGAEDDEAEEEAPVKRGKIDV